MKASFPTSAFAATALLAVSGAALISCQPSNNTGGNNASNGDRASAFASPVITQCQNPPPVSISSDVPTDVCIPAGFPGNPIQFFDDYSWRSFISMVWPAKPGERGAPDLTRKVGDPGQVVFETFKSDWEVIQPQGAAPAAWEKFDGANPCSLPTVGSNDLVLASFSKFDNLAQAGFGKLVGPLVAQNDTYVRYLTGFNKTEFTDVVTKQLYLRANLTNVTLSNGAIDVKSAWIDMKNVSHPERYYVHKQAWVFDLKEGKCLQKDMGLVALHIVQKTPSRPQWIWSTFEQVDNIPQPGATAPLAFHDGSATPMPTPPNPIPFPPPITPTSKFNVTRTVAISSSTQGTNAAYQSALRGNGGGPWQFYQLVATQWPLQHDPLQPIPPGQSGQPADTFPGTAASSSFSNVAMETFFQRNIKSGCMGCHDQTRENSDFVWLLEMHAFPSELSPPSLAPVMPGPALMNAQPKKLTPELRKLRELMQEATAKPTPN